MSFKNVSLINLLAFISFINTYIIYDVQKENRKGLKDIPSIDGHL